MAKRVIKLKDPDKIAITNRLRGVVRYLGEHVISAEWLAENYGDKNPLLFALTDDDNDKQVALIEVISLGLLNRALKGDVRAFEVVRDTIGEKPATNINVDHSTTTSLSELTTRQLEKLLELADKPTVPSVIIEAEVVEDNDPFNEGGDTEDDE